MSNRLEKDYDINQKYNHQDDVISFADMLHVVARQIKIIIITPTIVCLIALINALFFSMPVYKSTAKIMSSTEEEKSARQQVLLLNLESHYLRLALSKYG